MYNLNPFLFGAASERAWCGVQPGGGAASGEAFCLMKPAMVCSFNCLALAGVE
jgi:hypothetical protein